MSSSVTKLYVGNLSESVTSKHLKELFGNFGQVDEVAVLRGFGFVVSSTTPPSTPSPPLLPSQHFRRDSDASAALKSLDDTEFMGSRIQVQVCVIPHQPHPLNTL